MRNLITVYCLCSQSTTQCSIYPNISKSKQRLFKPQREPCLRMKRIYIRQSKSLTLAVGAPPCEQTKIREMPCHTVPTLVVRLTTLLGLFSVPIHFANA